MSLGSQLAVSEGAGPINLTDMQPDVLEASMDRITGMPIPESDSLMSRVRNFGHNVVDGILTSGPVRALEVGSAIGLAVFALDASPVQAAHKKAMSPARVMSRIISIFDRATGETVGQEPTVMNPTQATLYSGKVIIKGVCSPQKPNLPHPAIQQYVDYARYSVVTTCATNGSPSRTYRQPHPSFDTSSFYKQGVVNLANAAANSANIASTRHGAGKKESASTSLATISFAKPVTASAGNISTLMLFKNRPPKAF